MVDDDDIRLKDVDRVADDALAQRPAPVERDREGPADIRAAVVFGNSRELDVVEVARQLVGVGLERAGEGEHRRVRPHPADLARDRQRPPDMAEPEAIMAVEQDSRRSATYGAWVGGTSRGLSEKTLVHDPPRQRKRGCHPITVFTRVMSSRRCFGSSPAPAKTRSAR